MKLIIAKTSAELAEHVAELTVEALQAATNAHIEASWVLAGGSTPGAAYEAVVNYYKKSLDWSKIWFLIGDERHVLADSADSNWASVESSLLYKLEIEDDHKLVPSFDESVDLMASDYAKALDKLPKSGSGNPTLDLIWLGLGEDGHTLSLFPGRSLESNKLVDSVVDSPKPPSERISLTLKALENVDTCIILASGPEKADAVARLVSGGSTLPICAAVQTVEDNGGIVYLVIDAKAGEKLDR